MTYMYVFLFDIDGTLINSGGAGQAALAEAFIDVFDIPDPENVPVHGNTDRGIAADLFSRHDIDNTPENWQRFMDAYLHHLPQQLPRRQGKVLPGVVDLLNELSSRDDVAVGLLTGNVRRGAQIKLDYYRLMHHFKFGGFGDHHLQRNDVAQSALDEVKQRFNGQAALQRMWVVGDTPKDIQCARHIGVRVAAVATGVHSRDELAAEQPDLMMDGLTDSSALLAMLD